MRSASRCRASSTAVRCLVMEHVTRIDDDCAPDWPTSTQPGGIHRVRITGHPNLDVTIHGTEPGEPGAAGGGNATAANRIVNAIPAVCAAPAGPVSPLDLPPITGARAAPADVAGQTADTPAPRAAHPRPASAWCGFCGAPGLMRNRASSPAYRIDSARRRPVGGGVRERAVDRPGVVHHDVAGHGVEVHQRGIVGVVGHVDALGAGQRVGRHEEVGAERACGRGASRARSGPRRWRRRPGRAVSTPCTPVRRRRGSTRGPDGTWSAPGSRDPSPARCPRRARPARSRAARRRARAPVCRGRRRGTPASRPSGRCRRGTARAAIRPRVVRAPSR